jgi:catechol 2,3-dioxygenase-like lactoylglutathione lyase family enzyme
MDLECAHIVLNVSDVSKAKEFYIKGQGFDVVEDHPKSFAFKAGAVRFTVSPNGSSLNEQDPSNGTIIFRTQDIEKTVFALKERGISLSGGVNEAPGFMKFVSLSDPDNNPLMVAQYFRDPLKKV